MDLSYCLFIPIVRSETADRQSVVHQITNYPVVEGISHGDWLFYCLAAQIDTIARYPRFGGVVNAVSPGYFEVVARCPVLKVNPFLASVEGHNGSIAPKGHATECGEVGQSLHPIGIAQCQQRKSLSGHTLLSRMDAILKSGVEQYSHSRVLHFLFHQGLLLAQQALLAFQWISE